MWVLTTVIGIFLFLVILLAIPVDLIICVEKYSDFKLRVTVRWMFGLMGKEISRGKKEPKKEKKRRGSIKPLLAMLKTRGFPGKLFRFIRGVFRCFNVHDLKLNLRVGLGDPAETGLLFALIGPTMVCAGSFSSLDIKVEPDFYQGGLQGYSKADIRAFPLRLVGHLVRFTFSPTTIRAIKNIPII